MAINYSTNKVRVSKLLMSDAIVGMMDPVVGMQTQYGIITGLDSGNAQVTIGVGQGAPTGIGPKSQKFYPDQLRIDFAQATGVPFLFPTSTGSKAFGHHGTFPSGVPRDAASGQNYLGGDGEIHTFSRPPSTPH